MPKRLTKEELKKRPWLFQTKYEEVMTQDKLVSLMAKGHTTPMLCKALKISRSTLYQWQEDHPDFKKAYEYGKTLREAHHDEIAIHNYENPKFNPVTWQMMGRKYFGYSEYRAIKLPKMHKATNYQEKAQVAMEAMANGEITPNEALIISQVCANHAKTEAETELVKRLEALESKSNEGSS